MWLASIVMAVFFIYIFYTAQLYGSMAIYTYFFFASIYAWIRWLTKNRNEETGDHIIIRVPSKQIQRILLWIVVIFALCSVLIYATTNNPIPLILGDALVTSLNIVALWMATNKWAEQWCLLVVANLLSSILLYHQGEMASATMFLFYFVVSILGYQNWKKMTPQEE